MSQIKTLQVNPILWTTKCSIATNFFLACGKLVMGIIGASVFMIFHALYHVLMGLSKYYALKHYLANSKTVVQTRAYLITGLGVLAASGFYMAYSLRLLSGYEIVFAYPRELAIAFAAFTFTEIALNFRGSLVALRRNQPMLQALKLCSLASSIICLVLTQNAILSFTRLDVLTSELRGLSGVIFGSWAALVGLYMVAHALIERKRNSTDLDCDA